MWFCILLLLSVGAVEHRKSLSTPRRITAKVVSPHIVEVNWRDPDLNRRGGAKVTRLYIIRYKGTNNAVNVTDLFETVRTRHRRVKLDGLAPNTTYDISVKAVKNRKSSAWSKVITVTTNGLEDKLYVVRNLTAAPVASDAIMLSWLPPEQANKVVAYTILTQLANGKGRQRKDVANKEMLEYKVGNLRPHLLYSFRVQTMQKLEPHPISPPILARPYSDVPSGPPRDVTLQVINSSRILVTWQPPSPHLRNGQLLGYTFQYKHTGAGSGDVNSVNIEGGVRKYKITNIIVNETYQIQIAAKTINGTGPYTKWETVFVEQINNTETVKRDFKKEDSLSTTSKPTISEGLKPDFSPLPPSEVKVVNKTGPSVHLVWSAPEPSECCPVVAYKIVIRNYNDSSENEIVRGTTHVHLTGLTPSTLYGVSVIALSMTSESSPSDESVFTTFEAVPPAVVFFQATTVYLGGDANLTCIGRGYEIPKIDWFISTNAGNEERGENIIKISDSDSDIAENVRIISSMETHDSLTSSLLMYKVTRAAERVFVCVARNSLGSDTQRLYLQLSEPPRIVMSYGMSVMIGAVTKLVCEAYGKPIPEILWVHPTSGVVFDERPGNDKDLAYATSSLRDSNYTRQSFLIIKNISVQDGGPYTCMAQSRAGRAEAKVVLNVKVPPPGPVYKIQTIPLSPSRVSVSWLPPLNYGYNIAYYQVSYRKKHGGQTVVFNTTRVRAELYDLDHSTEYLVGVTAGTDDSLGESGPEVEVMTLTNEGLQPANVSVKAFNNSIIQLDWEAPNSISQMYIRGYNVYSRREGEDRTEKLFVRGSSSKQFLIGLGRDDTYYLKISTLMTWGYEAHSPWIRIQKQSEVYLPPGKPQNVSAMAKLNEITLSWEAPSMSHPGLQPLGVHLKGYKIVYGPLNDPLNVSRATLEADKRNHIISGLEPSTKYIISIRAFNDIGDGEPVYTRTKTQAYPPSMVQNASARPVSSTEIHVQWEPPKRGQVTQYHIRYWRPGRKDKQSAWLTGNFQNYVAGSLKKNSNYRFEIIPYNGELLGEGIVIFSYTYGDKPDGPPTNVTIRPLNSTVLVASWNVPDPEKTNGHITGYKLVLRSLGGSRMASFTVPGTARTYTFLNMPVSSTYKFRMAAMTINGTGVYSPLVEYSFSSSPEKPAPPQNLSVSETETSLTLQWKPPRFTGSPVHGYIVGFGQFIPEVYRQILSASQMTYTIRSLKPDSEYITSVRAFNHIGESSPAFSIVRTKPVSPLTTPLLAPVKLLVRSESPTSLNLSWVDPSLSDKQKTTDGRAYLIRFSPLSGETYSYVNTSHLQHQLSDLEPATKYEVSVKVMRGSNSSTWSLPVVNSTQQIAPSSAPEKIMASPLPRNPSLISLKWSEPRSPNGKIEEYIIYLTSDPSLDTKLWVVMRTEKQEVKIRDVIPHTTYYFKLQARNRAGYGPLSETVVYSPPTDITAVPTNLTVAALNSNMSTTVKVAWSVPEVSLGQITGYMVYYTDNIQEDADWLVQTERGLDTVIVSLQYNRTYYFKVQARYSAAYGPFSKTVSYTTSPHVSEPTSTSDIEDETKHNDNSINRDDNSGDEDDSNSDVSVRGNIQTNKDLSVTDNIHSTSDVSVTDNIHSNSVTGSSYSNSDVSVTGNSDSSIDFSVTDNIHSNRDISIADNFHSNSVTGSSYSNSDVSVTGYSDSSIAISVTDNSDINSNARVTDKIDSGSIFDNTRDDSDNVRITDSIDDSTDSSIIFYNIDDGDNKTDNKNITAEHNDKYKDPNLDNETYMGSIDKEDDVNTSEKDNDEYSNVKDVENEDNKNAKDYDVDDSESLLENGQDILPKSESNFDSTSEHSVNYDDNIDVYDDEEEDKFDNDETKTENIDDNYDVTDMSFSNTSHGIHFEDYGR